MSAKKYLESLGIKSATCYTSGAGTYYINDVVRLMEDYNRATKNILIELTEVAANNPSGETPRLTAAIVAAQKFLTGQLGQ